MKKNRLCAPLALLLSLALAAGCAGAPAPSSEAPLREEDARIPGEGSGFVIRLEGEPPVSQQVWENTVIPGFGHSTLPEAYLRAREVFRLFRGNPSHVEDFPREDGTWYQPGTLSREIDGKLYYRAWNRYENWADFEAMVRAEYTEETGWRFDRFDDPAYTDRTYPPQQRQEYTDLSFLTEEQQALFTAARQAADDYLFGSAGNILGLPGNRMGETFSARQNGFTVEAAVVEGADGDYAALTQKMRRLFTGEYLEKTGFTQRRELLFPCRPVFVLPAVRKSQDFARKIL